MLVDETPTHDSPLPHGSFVSHDPFRIPTSTQVIVAATQFCPGPHREWAQESPSAGCAAQVPQSAFAVPPQ